MSEKQKDFKTVQPKNNVNKEVRRTERQDNYRNEQKQEEGGAGMDIQRQSLNMTCGQQ